MNKPKINHKAEKVSEIFPDHKLDKEKLDRIWHAMHSDPAKLLGKTKSETYETIVDRILEPEFGIALATIVVQGIAAKLSMDALSEGLNDKLKSMDTSEMPTELRDKILADPKVPEELKAKLRDEIPNPQAGDTDDEFEKLKRSIR